METPDEAERGRPACEPQVRALLRRGERALYLVPEQDTVEAELFLSRELNLDVLWNLEVLSPTRLAQRIRGEAGGSARFDVFDHGNGISKQEQKYIWDRFSRASQKYKRGDSTGLGLSIVRSILKSHDAVFGVNSAVGKGSDFYFELPLVEPPQN